MPLSEDWRAFSESLNSNGVEYVVTFDAKASANRAAMRRRTHAV